MKTKRNKKYGHAYGNDMVYLVRRLKGQAPEVAAALARGEFPSARAAGIAAGIVRVPTALDRAKRACEKLNESELLKLWDWLFDGMESAE